MLGKALSLVQTITTFGMFGVIWVIQLVHYPAFAYMDSNRFVQLHQHHTTGISLLVVPLMLGELIAAAGLCFLPEQVSVWQWVLLGLVVMIWLSTFLLQVPLHGQLGQGLNQDVAQRLVSTNWIRTVLWSIKAAIVAWMLWNVS